MSRSYIAIGLGGVLVLLAAAGCSDNFTVYPVAGKVSLEGKPMQGGGSISLVPVGDQPGKAAGGNIAEDGSYKLSTYGDGDGSIPGEFRVVISQVTFNEGKPTGEGEERVTNAVRTVAAADQIPAIYADSMKSPLRATVEEKTNEINFDLKRNAK